MRNVLLSVTCVVCLASPLLASAQTAQAPPSSSLLAPASSSFWSPFKQAPQDVANLFSSDTARILGVVAGGALVAHQWDDEGISLASHRLQPRSRFQMGNVAGSMPAQLGGAIAVYSIARATGSARAAAVGGDLIRAQVLTQFMVQTMKVSFQRERPDGSNKLSLPSGHTAGAVATATVLTRHFGWKVGIPAYTASAYVAASRMSANKHHLTDVMFGAAVGVVAGRTATIGIAKHRFNVGVSPTVGGAAITLTKH